MLINILIIRTRSSWTFSVHSTMPDPYPITLSAQAWNEIDTIHLILIFLFYIYNEWSLFSVISFYQWLFCSPVEPPANSDNRYLLPWRLDISAMHLSSFTYFRHNIWISSDGILIWAYILTVFYQGLHLVINSLTNNEWLLKLFLMFCKRLA